MLPSTILITGAANGLGRAMTLGAIATGHKVIAVDQDVAGLDLLNSNSSSAGLLDTRAVNLADETAISCLVKSLAPQGVDVLVNNAGIGPAVVRPDFFSNPYNIWEIPPERWRLGMAVNLDAPFLLIRGLVPGMRERRFGRVINITTNFDSMMRPHFAPYGCSKAALEAMTAALATELKGSGVTVNALIPGGPADTSMIPHDARMNRSDLIKPSAMVAPLLWLLTDSASNFTGRRIIADSWTPPEIGNHPPGHPLGWPDLAGTDRSTPMARG